MSDDLVYNDRRYKRLDRKILDEILFSGIKTLAQIDQKEEQKA